MLGTHSNACQLEILALNPRAQARTGRWRKNRGTKAATRRPAPCNPKNGMLYRHFRGHYAAVTEHDEIRFSHPHAAGLGCRAPHDSRTRRSRRREEAPPDVPALRDPGTQRDAARGDAAEPRVRLDGHGWNELRRDRCPDQQVDPGARRAPGSWISRNPEVSSSSSRLA